MSLQGGEGTQQDIISEWALPWAPGRTPWRSPQCSDDVDSLLGHKWGVPTPMCWGPPGPQCHPVSEGAPEQAAGTPHGTFCRRVMSHGPWVVWFYSQEGTHGVCSV